MRILHIVPSYLPAVRYGGPIVSVHGLCRALSSAGHEVDVFSTLIDGDRNLDIEPGVRVDVDGVGVHYFAATMPRRWYYSPSMAAALNKRVRDYDVLHIHALFLHPISAGAAAAWRAQAPYLLSPRGMLVRSLFKQRSRRLKSAWMTLVGRRVIERATAVHVTSAAERAEINAFNLDFKHVVEVPNGIDALTTSASGAPRDPNLVLFLGRLSWKKQIDRLIAAMADCPHLRLVVAGNDDEGLLPALQAQAQGLNVAQRVQFVGAVHGRQKDEWYARAGMFVLPSRSENFANTVLEAMAAGCAVIITPAVGLAQAVRESGCGIVCDDTAGALAAAMQRLAEDPRRADDMGARGKQLVRQNYLWPTVAARMSHVYADLMRERR